MEKISKRKFIALLKDRMDLTYEDAKYVYENFIGLMSDELLKGNKLILTGFGTIYLKTHKGHIVRNKHIDDYLYVKFVTSNVLNTQLQNDKALFDKIAALNNEDDSDDE